MIAISSCVVGEACRFDGTCQDLAEALRLQKYGNVIKVCPELLGGLTTPRNPAEIQVVDGEVKVMTKQGEDVTDAFSTGANKTFEICKKHKVKYVILKDRSPSCGKGYIYNGYFDGTLIEGNGLTSKLLLDHGIEVYNTSDAPYDKLMVYDFLEEHDISYKVYKHKPVYTVEEAERLSVDMNGQHCKNLFLETKNKKTQILAILPSHMRFDFKKMEAAIGLSKLKFASSDRLKNYLGIEAGSVGLFGLLYNLDREVTVAISKSFDPNSNITFHPNVNDETLSIKYSDMIRVLDILGYKPTFVE